MFRRIITLTGLLAAFATGVLVTLNWPGRPGLATPPAAPTATNPPAAPAAPVIQAEAPPAPLPAPVAEANLHPTAAEYPEIIDLLRAGYLESPALAGTPLNAETLPGVLERARDKIRLATNPTQGASPSTKTLLEMLPGGVAYWRPRSFDPPEIERLVREWSLWKSAKPNGVVIDLRFFTDPNNFTGAAPAAALFLSPGHQLFTVQGLNQPQRVFKSERQPLDLPSWMPILLLVNRDTRGAAEAFAWSLRQGAGALLVGQPTAGEGGLFRETRLKSGRFLRLATARALTADGTDLLASRLAPDLLAEATPEKEREAFLAAAKYGTATLLAEPEPLPRLNQDISSQVLNAEAEKKNQVPLADPVLKAACDAVAAIQIKRQPPASTSPLSSPPASTP
ncbi:MAG: S41 family peptidase [Candidatus Methylacidiphilales bacterium]|nr:S41 family peptidase [Candidatus Methylacidiphilales bacterium]